MNPLTGQAEIFLAGQSLYSSATSHHIDDNTSHLALHGRSAEIFNTEGVIRCQHKAYERIQIDPS